jgi:hypothetical protein
MKLKSSIVMLVAVLVVFCCSALASAQNAPSEDRIERLERMLQELGEEVKRLKSERAEQDATVLENKESIIRLGEDFEDMSDSVVSDPDSWVNRLTLGGYGEMHANFGEGKESDQFDFHRMVLYLGYDFNDWMKLNVETEIEHAYVTDGSGGELLFEQAYIDFMLSDAVNIRAGRVLTPLGIVNSKHEPPSFNGVERPSFAKYIIPTTWSSDGVGVFGSITPSLKYEAYVVSGLDGSGFSSKDGIRGGRIKERPSLHEPAVTARLDYYPFALREASHNQVLRLGVSGYYGGLDNGNKGNNPDVDGDIGILSADFEYSIDKFDFRGALAFEKIDDAADIGGGVASEIFGWYLEGAYHIMPESWKTGKLERGDAVAFVRYDNFDTQYDMPSGVAKNPAGDREEWTIGLGFYPIPSFVVKADYQIRDDASSDDLADLFNVGVGWQF